MRGRPSQVSPWADLLGADLLGADLLGLLGLLLLLAHTQLADQVGKRTGLEELWALAQGADPEGHLAGPGMGAQITLAGWPALGVALAGQRTCFDWPSGANLRSWPKWWAPPEEVAAVEC